MPLHKTPSRTRRLDDRSAVIRLFDAYAGLLTARQQLVVRMYYHDDLSLGEIAERLHVSRQAVFDGLRRAVGEMRRLEDGLRMLGGSRRNGRDAAARLLAVEREAARLAASGAAATALLRALRALREAMPVP